MLGYLCIIYSPQHFCGIHVSSCWPVLCNVRPYALLFSIPGEMACWGNVSVHCACTQSALWPQEYILLCSQTEAISVPCHVWKFDFFSRGGSQIFVHTFSGIWSDASSRGLSQCPKICLPIILKVFQPGKFAAAPVAVNENNPDYLILLGPDLRISLQIHVRACWKNLTFPTHEFGKGQYTFTT